MSKIKKQKLLLFVSCVLGLAVTFIVLFVSEKQLCMGVPFMPAEKLECYERVDSFDVTQLLLNGEPVALDSEHNIVYIHQAESNLSHFSDLKGHLKLTDPAWSLFFLDSSPANLSAAIREGTPLYLVAVKGNQCYPISVVLTTLPVIHITGMPTHVNEDGRNVMSGKLAVWSTAENSRYSTQTSLVQWHVRGRSTAGEPKNSWKLSLKQDNGDSNDLDLLNMGADDDWILNGLTMDDTRIKEKLFIDLWNSMAAGTDYNYKMSCGEYAEVIINNRYMGIYLLQRRIDAKYLQLSDDDVLLKGITYSAKSAREAYRFVTPENNTTLVYSIMQGTFTRTDCSSLHLRNLIDTNLMIQLVNARDNCGVLNMYHLLKFNGDEYVQYLIPWDTDQSFGIIWKSGVGFCYDMELSLEELGKRVESESVAALYPQYDSLVRQRWQELRTNLFSQESLLNRVTSLNIPLVNSGALQRDISLWGMRYHGVDSIDNLKEYILKRLDILDRIYG